MAQMKHWKQNVKNHRPVPYIVVNVYEYEINYYLYYEYQL